MIKPNYNIILASKSPRRQDLLKQMGVEFVVETKDIEEDYPATLKGHEIAEYLSKHKTLAFLNELKESDLLITADTIVCYNDSVLGKPRNYDEAYEMLSLLSGKQHQVITGVAVTTTTKQKIFSAITHVTFKQLSDNEINYYINKFKPFDKAGSYGIQEWIGLIAITKIEGSYFNVVGLPTQQLYNCLVNNFS